jgi:osmotically inducible protein OsmC
MPTRNGIAVWEGGFPDGSGKIGVGSETFAGSYSTASRFENGKGTNPEELIGAAHAGCFSMALAHELTEAGYTPKRIDTTADVTIEKKENGFTITSVVLNTRAEVSGVDESTFAKLAQEAKTNCPVSRALAGVDISLQHELVSAVPK